MSYNDYLNRVTGETLVAVPCEKDPDFVEVPAIYDSDIGWEYQDRPVSPTEAREIFIKLGKPVPPFLEKK